MGQVLECDGKNNAVFTLRMFDSHQQCGYASYVLTVWRVEGARHSIVLLCRRKPRQSRNAVYNVPHCFGVNHRAVGKGIIAHRYIP